MASKIINDPKYQRLVAEVENYIDTLAHPLQTVARPFFQLLAQRKIISFIAILPTWMADILKTSSEVCHRLGVAHLYTCWYYHAQDHLLDDETASETLLGGHLALIKMIEIYQSLGLMNSPCWVDFQHLTQLSAETYALEMKSRFNTLAELTPTHLSIFNLDFMINRVAPFLFNTTAQLWLANIPPTAPLYQQSMNALRAIFITRQLGDDIDDWLSELKEGQLNYVSAHLIKHFHQHHPQIALANLTIEQLIQYQLMTPSFWVEIEETMNKFNQQALSNLIDFDPCHLRTEFVEPQIAHTSEFWPTYRLQQNLLREMLPSKNTQSPGQSGQNLPL